MLPSEGLKTLISCAMTESDGARMPVEMAVWDVPRAHLYGKSRRWLHAKLLDGHEQLGKLARLERSLCGTQDAAAIWSEMWAEKLEQGGIYMEKAHVQPRSEAHQSQKERCEVCATETTSWKPPSRRRLAEFGVLLTKYGRQDTWASRATWVKACGCRK